jgi:uncharacterized protein GlcG (DUF336 family)
MKASNIVERRTSMRIQKFLPIICVILISTVALSQAPSACNSLPDHNKLRSVLQAVVKEGKQANGGMGNPRWAVIVDRDGIGCAVVFSSDNRSQVWPGSRMIAAEKANTANAVSGPDYAFSTANLFFPTQPGQSLYGLITTSAPNPQAAFGDPTSFGQENDPIVGKAVGGIVVFGGGLALYSAKGEIVGGLGVSGGTSCSDHVIAWKVRHQLNLDAVPMGPSPDHNDNMILDIQNGVSASGFGHPVCKGGNPGIDIIKNLSKNFPTGPRK